MNPPPSATKCYSSLISLFLFIFESGVNVFRPTVNRLK